MRCVCVYFYSVDIHVCVANMYVCVVDFQPAQKKRKVHSLDVCMYVLCIYVFCRILLRDMYVYMYTYIYICIYVYIAGK